MTKIWVHWAWFYMHLLSIVITELHDQTQKSCLQKCSKKAHINSMVLSMTCEYKTQSFESQSGDRPGVNIQGINKGLVLSWLYTDS